METLLTIDDDPATHALVDACLANRSMTCLSAYDGESGLLTAREENPGLILLDVNMPDLRGHEVCRRLKKDIRTREIPVIFLSSENEAGVKADALDRGAIDYVTKPFEPTELQARVASALRTKRTMDLAVSKAGIDETTGLYNRLHLERQIEADLAAARRTGRPLACCLISMDPASGPACKPGTPVADELTRVASGAILASLRREDAIYRFGRRTFAVLASLSDGKAASELAERILSAVLSAGIHCCDEPANITCCIGMAISRYSFGSCLIREAEKALGDARATGKDCIRFSGELLQLSTAEDSGPARPRN